MASKKVAMMMMMMMTIVMVMILAERSIAFDLCGLTNTELNECKPSVTKENPTTPTQLCCDALHHADFTCLCGYKTSPWVASFGIDPELAIGLPVKCGQANAPTC
ncbi:unnamed protein product [Cochlearia groenlandica]